MKNKLYFLCLSIICISSGCKHEAILDRYTDQKGNLYVYNPFPLEGQERMNFGQDVNIDYIIYLAQQHNIFSFFRDSEGIFHIYVTRYK